MSRTVGVIGGMGPEATVDFLRRIVAATPARDDADHIRVLVDNNPKIPSRIAALIDGNGADPLPVLIEMARGLERQGADFLTIPCNTAHYYLPRIAQAVSIPILDMIALTIAKAQGKRVGILASPAVQKVGLYTSRLAAAGRTAVFPDAQGEAKVIDVICAVKANALTERHRGDYAEAAAALDVDGYLLACTELSVIGPPAGITKPHVDALDVLVEATVKLALS
jgi:aspartate racemase